MNANSVKNALTRKIGPLPAWAWLGGLAVAIIIYRRRLSAQGSANDQAQVAASDGTTGYYGPYGQDNYPINGGAFTGGGGDGSGTATNGPGSSPPPTINVNVPGGAGGHGGKGAGRISKPKAQHLTKGHGKAGTPIKRTHATTHNGRQHPHGSGKSRNTASVHITRSHSGGTKPPAKRVRKKR